MGEPVIRQQTMRFWKIEELKSELRLRDLNPREALSYLVVTGALTTAIELGKTKARS